VSLQVQCHKSSEGVLVNQVNVLLQNSELFVDALELLDREACVLYVGWHLDRLHVEGRALSELESGDTSADVLVLQKDDVDTRGTLIDNRLDVLDGLLSNRVLFLHGGDYPVVEHVEYLVRHLVHFEKDEHCPRKQGHQSNVEVSSLDTQQILSLQVQVRHELLREVAFDLAEYGLAYFLQDGASADQVNVAWVCLVRLHASFLETLGQILQVAVIVHCNAREDGSNHAKSLILELD
jgi:hypothetical protein